jgi:hypothetical protein
MAKPTPMPTMTAKAPEPSANQKPFSLVPAASQRQMYKAVAALKPATPEITTGAEVAEIALCLAIDDKDPVIVASSARGARSVRKGCKAISTGAKGGKFSAATVTAVAALLADSEATALVCAGKLEPQDDYRAAFAFASRHKLPILFLVANTLTPKRPQELDLRTLHAEFGIPVFSVDAKDAIASYRVATEALHNARHHRGPCVIEAVTLNGKKGSATSALNLLREYMQRHENWPL